MAAPWGWLSYGVAVGLWSQSFLLMNGHAVESIITAQCWIPIHLPDPGEPQTLNKEFQSPQT
jgi:hypothetical protein